jgi:hypothetical protein
MRNGDKQAIAAGMRSKQKRGAKDAAFSSSFG